MAKLSAAWWATMAAAIALTMTACSAPPAPDKYGRPVVLTTFTVLADIAANVAGNRLAVESITKPGAEIHGYEPTPSDMRRAEKAALILDNGLGLEAWFAKFVEDLRAPHVVVSNGVRPINIATDAYAGKPNPHAWMSPQNVMIYVDNIVAAFTALDPGGRATFRANAQRYKRSLRAVQDDLIAALDRLPQAQRALVTCEGAFSYLARDVGLAERYIWPVNAEQQATPQQVAATIDFVTARKMPAVFCESTVSDRAMRQVATATGAQFGGTLYVDSLSTAHGPVPTYLALIRHDAMTIVGALTGRRQQ